MCGLPCRRSNGCLRCRRRDSRLLLLRSRPGEQMLTADRAGGAALAAETGSIRRGDADPGKQFVTERRGMPRLSKGSEIGGLMNRLYVLYDANCGLCSSVREWVQDQAQLVAMEFVAANSPQAAVMFPSLSRPGQRPEELIVVDDGGGVYREGHAWIMCLYGLADYRALSLRLASPSLLPLARKAFSFLSKRRGALSELLGMGSDRQMAARLEQENWIGCAPAPNPAGYDVASPRISGAAEMRDGWSN